MKTIMDLYNEDQTIFDALTVPEVINKEDLKIEILARTVGMDSIAQDPILLKKIIKTWSAVRNPEWNRMSLAFNAEYNPIHNYDKSEEWTDDRQSHSETAGDENVKGSDKLDGKVIEDLQRDVDAHEDSDNLTAAYNEGPTLDGQVKTKSGSLETNSGTTTNSQTNQNTQSKTNTSSQNESGTQGHVGHTYGNIGMTKTQEMIDDELKLRRQSMTEIVVNEFKNRFCILLYNY